MPFNTPEHVAIIMDGNGRWAKLRNKPRVYGHKKGLDVIDHVIEAAIANKVHVLSLFAFSCENWNRPKSEVKFLMSLVENALSKKNIDSLNKKNIQFRWTGFIDKLSKTLVNKLIATQNATKKNKKLIFNLCFNYGGTQDIIQAANKIANNKNLNFSELLLTNGLPPVDLLIRTGDEKRISNFLLFQSAYAEIIFEPTYWPDYNSQTFKKNLLEYSHRQRRFGKV